MTEQFHTEVSHTPTPDISRRSPPLPTWLANRLLRAGEEITWVYGPRFNPSWERYVTHPALFLAALTLGVCGVVAGSGSKLLPLLFLGAGGLLVGSVFILGIASGYFTRLVVTNFRLVIFQGYELCRAWDIDDLPRSLIRYVRSDRGPESRAIDLDSLKTMLGTSVDKIVGSTAIMTFGKRLDQIKTREDGRP